MALIVGPSAGQRLPGAGQIVVKVQAEDTNDVMAVLEETLRPRQLVPPHTHQNDVWVYVLSGEIGVLVGEEIGTTTAGGWALKPRNIVHAMWNATAEPARIIEVLTPAGTERWFEEITQLAAGDQAGFDAACRRHGIQFLSDSPWTAELRRRYDLL